MPRKRYKPEEIVAKLRQVDVLVSQGQHSADAIRQIGVSEVTYYRWRQEYGGLKTEQVKRLKELETEEHPSTQSRLGPDAGQAHSAGGGPGKTLKPRASPRLYRADQSAFACLRAPRLCGARPARRSARHRGAVKTKSGSPPTSSSLPGNTVATAIARSPGCWSRRAGSSTTNGSSGSGDARG